MQAVEQPAEILGKKRIIKTHLISGLLYQFLRRHDTGSGEHVTYRISGGQISQQECHETDTNQYDHNLKDSAKNLFLIQNNSSFLTKMNKTRTPTLAAARGTDGGKFTFLPY